MLTEVRLPELGENISGADVASVLVHEGEIVHKEDPLAELESEKAFMEFPSPYEGVIREVKIHSGEKIKIGDVLFVIDSAAPEDQLQREELPSLESGFISESPKPEPSREIPKVKSSESGEILSSPISLRLARELGVDIKKIPGSGPGGFITKDDVLNFSKKIPADFSISGLAAREPMNSIRRTTAKNVILSAKEIPHVTQFDHADITSLEDFRKKNNSENKRINVPEAASITLTAILIKITSLVLQKYKYLNSSIDMTSEEIILKDYVHMGVAVDTDHGLLVPVIKNSDTKGIRDISKELRETAEKARNRKLMPDDFSGASFSITNLGGFGTTYFTPIITAGQCAILGVGKAQIQPQWDGSEFIPRLILPLSLSYDHRIVDGAYAAKFLRSLAISLQEPINLLL